MNASYSSRVALGESGSNAPVLRSMLHSAPP